MYYIDGKDTYLIWFEQNINKKNRVKIKFHTILIMIMEEYYFV